MQLLAVSRDITERRREEAVRAAQQHVLGMIATGSALADVLDCLVRLVEQQAERHAVLGAAARRGRHPRPARRGTEPARATTFARSTGSPIGPRSGSCGTAMFRGTPVIVTDILTDPLWDDYREVARQYGLRACWSMPIFSPQRTAARFVCDVLRRAALAERRRAAG